MNKILSAGFALILLSLSSCDLVNPQACDLQFVSITVEISGADLNQTYTITDQTDTLHVGDNLEFGDFYTIVSDSNQDELEGDEIEVEFHGYIGDSLAVVEPFTVGADICHVYKVSGKDKIEL